MRQVPSPNWDERPADEPIDMLVLHYTGMQSAQAALDRLRDPAARVSSHYVVEENGTIWQLVDETKRAFHAGVSSWRGHETLNGRSIGVEIVNPGHEWGYRGFPALQMDAVATLCAGILGRHPIPPRNVVAHSDVAPDRKQDPGELFDWAGLARQGIGFWPEHGSDAVPGAEQALRKIGYPVPDLDTAVRAFQRRWLPAHVDGVADRATRCRMADVLAVVDGAD